MDNLKPCPFCGAEAIMLTFATSFEKVPRFRVACSACWCKEEWNNFKPEEAAEKWNRRKQNDRRGSD